ncbi:hypothetical protein SAMN04488056_106135 [Cohaesibacter marisflavi]|uniref:Prophage minor tail protein Z (GPZ) n=1 Tax=Cohaesibacter marisflavi TaxID=655353 RepID=A0A1I5HBA7_9HYPH|nr:hypothetical protein [Cohaesibacter marisflavi]SFO45487.1 hypothetical protein SAMN04488056_106135 [Cohaesibacter marisflavi]
MADLEQRDVIDVDLSNFEKTLDLIQTMGNKSPRMLQATVRQAGRRAMTPWRQATAKQAGVKARKIQRSTKTKSYASAGEFIYEIRVRAEWSYLTEFSPAQTDEGIEASPWGSRQIFAGSFFGTVEAGKSDKSHLGVFIRQTEDRLPIRQLYGPNVAIEGARGKAADTFEKESEEALNATLQQEIAQLFT